MGNGPDRALALFFEVMEDMPRGGPGDPAATLRALGLIPHLPPRPRILDLGCGPGQQTLTLAGHTDGHVTALDNHAPFIERLRRRASELGLGERVRAVVGDFLALDLPERSFDLIWSEGAIYLIGFERGLKEWGRFLEPGGFLAVSEAVWLRPDPDEELKAYWRREYPAMTDVSGCLDIIRARGYETLGHFTLPVSVWWDSYYTPMGHRLAVLKEKYRANEEALEVLRALERDEISFFRKTSDFWGYEYFVCRKGPGAAG
jgi:SAM-dependent methyltransferase